MANELPNLGADIILEFQQSINNIQLFGQAMEGLDNKFGTIERRIDSLRSSLSSMSAQVSRGTGRNLRADIERELNDLVAGNGIVLSKVGTAAFRVDATTIRDLMQRVNAAINTKLADSFRNIVLEIDPSLNTGKIPIHKDDFDEVNRAIARLVRVQLNNLVAALRQHGAGLISAQDLSAIQFHIGRGTVQQIVNKVKDHIRTILLNPSIPSGAGFEMSDRDLDRVFRAIKNKINSSIQEAVTSIDSRKATDMALNMTALHDAIDKSARDYIREVTRGINSIGRASLTKPVDQLSNQLKRFMAKELGTDLEGFNKIFADHKFTNQDIHAAELRRQFARLEQALNRKISGGLNEEVRQIVRSIEAVEISYSPRLHQHIVREISHINNQIVKKIREQIDLQFMHMRAEIAGVQVAPKDINRARRVREMGRVHYEESARPERRTPSPITMANDPYARRDAYFNSFGLEGAITNTLRHILAGSLVGTPLMLLYRSFEQYRTSQLEQLKMFANLFAKADAESAQRAAQGDMRDATVVAREIVNSIMPFVKEAAVTYAVDYGQMTAVASVGSRLLDDAASVKVFTDVVGKIFSIDREGDPVEGIAPGLEAFMGQFDMHVSELERRVVAPLAVATNLTNATTESVMNAVMRSGSAFKASGVSPEEAIAMIATSIQYTGLTGENIGNFYKTVLPRLRSPNAMSQLERMGIEVYEEREDGVKIARSALDIMKDVSDLYNRIDDDQARKTILAMFGTHQSAKGATTLDEMNSVIEMVDAISKFDVSRLDELLTQNLGSPIVEMERAGVSVIESLTTVMEELTPSVVNVARGLTNLSDKISENSARIAGFIQFLGSALLGYATVYGARRIYGTKTVQNAIDRTSTLEGLYGNRGIAGRGATQGVLQSLSDIPNIRRDILTDSKDNRKFIGRAMEDPTLSPVIKDLSTMNDTRMKELRSYIQDNNLVVKDMKDLVLAAEESRGYVGRRELTPEEVWGGSQFAARRLRDVPGLDKDFVEDLATQLHDRNSFDQLAKTGSGAKLTSFLAGLDEKGIAQFKNHLEDLHRQTGKTIADFDGLANAVDSFRAVQQGNIEDIRKTNPQLLALSNSVDKVADSMSNAKMNRGLRNFDSFLGGITSKSRAAVSAVGGLARTVGRLGGQMLLFAGIGEAIGNMTYNVSASRDQKALDKAEKAMKDFQDMGALLDNFTSENYHWLGTTLSTFGGNIWRDLTGAWDFVTDPTKDQYFDTGSRDKVFRDMLEYARDNLGLDVDPSDAYGGIYSGEMERNFVKKLEEAGYTVEDFMNKMQEDLGEESPAERLRDLQRQAYIKRFEEMALEEEENRTLQEQLERRVQERNREAALKGSYGILDLPTLRATIQEEAEKLDATASLNQLRALLDGHTTDSEQYVNLRKEQNLKIKELYDEQLELMRSYITGLENVIRDMRANGATEDEINIKQQELDNAKHTFDIVEREFGLRSAQIEVDTMQMEYEAAMSRIGRAAEQSEVDLAIRRAISEQTMDRSSKEYVDSVIGISKERIENLGLQIEQIRSAALTDEQREEAEAQIRQLRAQIEQERVSIRDLRLSAIGLYKQDLQDALAELSNEYLQARVDMGGADESNPILRNLRVRQYQEQIGLFDAQISALQGDLKEAIDVEEQKDLQRQIRDLQRQSLQAQLGILDELKNTGGTFNLPENVRAMTYYEYITRNNTHSTYTVQGGDTHVTISMPNITDGTSIERIRQIGQAFGQGVHEGRRLRLQTLSNPHGYRG